MTSSPTRTGPAGPATSGPARVTTPAASEPNRIGSQDGSPPRAPLYTFQSTGFTPAAPTSISASPGPGWPAG